MATAALTALMDASIKQDSATNNYGAATTLTVKNASGVAKGRVVLVFDTSSVPANATISSAQLSLRCESTVVANQPSRLALMLVGETLSDVIEGTGTTGTPTTDGVSYNTVDGSESFATAGGDKEPGVAEVSFDPNASTTPGVIADINVTDQLNYARTNYGHLSQVAFLLYQVSGTNATVNYASKEAGGGKQPPTLTITYTVPDAAPSGVQRKPVTRRPFLPGRRVTR